MLSPDGRLDRAAHRMRAVEYRLDEGAERDRMDPRDRARGNPLAGSHGDAATAEKLEQEARRPERAVRHRGGVAGAHLDAVDQQPDRPVGESERAPFGD